MSLKLKRFNSHGMARFVPSLGHAPTGLIFRIKSSRRKSCVVFRKFTVIRVKQMLITFADAASKLGNTVAHSEHRLLHKTRGTLIN